MHWAQLRQGQLDAMSRKTPVLLPVAATEQHGEHLPLNTDCLILEAIVRELDRVVDDRLLILPTQQVGCSEHHMALPGSLTLSHETFRRAVTEVADSVVRHGFKRVMILNGHGGNHAIDAVLGEQLGQRYPQVQTLVADWWTVAAKRIKPMQEGSLGSVGHACEFETSLMLAIAPQLVNLDAAEDGGIQHHVESMWFDAFQGPVAACYRPFHVLSHNGVYGRPSLASEKKGRRLLEATVESLKELIVEFWPDWE